jgi:quercetin dioxygenase-like cupin family protein
MCTLPADARGLANKTFGAVHPEDIQWMPYPALGSGAYTAIVVGEPSMPAPYVVRVKVSAGLKIMPHTHPEDRVYTVIAGVFYIGQGNTFDPAKLEAYPPGSVVVLPGNTSHFHWAKSGDYITQVYGIGPLGVAYIDPTDDPREKL